MAQATDQQSVVIIGGAAVGSFVALSLREQGFEGPISVLERDPTYARCSTALSAASVRTQFGCSVNVQLGLYGARFFKSVAEEIGFIERGYLITGDEPTVPARRAGVALQNAEGAQIAIMDGPGAAERFPWLNPEGLAVATYGEADEGWFDAWLLLQLVRKRAIALGVEYRNAEAVDVELTGDRVTAVVTASGERLGCDWCVNAAGPAGGKVAKWIGADLPVEPRKRTVFFLKAPLDGSNFPMLFDTTGAWIRPERDGFIAGIAPEPANDPDATDDFEPDHGLLEDLVWPALAYRIPALEQLRVQSAWAGHYEMNLLDHNGVIGPHDRIGNFLFANGFSGHGVMQSPGTGRGIAELIRTGAYQTLDLSPLGWERIRDRRPFTETVVY
jgi:FAD-dependent oxidoreductase domain-containing protein 1